MIQNKLAYTSLSFWLIVIKYSLLFFLLLLETDVCVANRAELMVYCKFILLLLLKVVGLVFLVFVLECTSRQFFSAFSLDFFIIFSKKKKKTFLSRWTISMINACSNSSLFFEFLVVLTIPTTIRIAFN